MAKTFNGRDVWLNDASVEVGTSLDVDINQVNGLVMWLWWQPSATERSSEPIKYYGSAVL